MGIPYRPEIDGLRAFAVLGVMAFHAGVGGAGFVGVDVFFVISGYLITALLLREWQATGGIDLAAFYARRVRRIVPAATVVVLASLALSALLLAPREQAHVGWSAASALAFVANVFFQFTSGGYFDGRAEEMPLLHLWSLSVEEQFYLAWPALLLMLLRRRPRNLLPVVSGLALVSFVAAEWLLAGAGDAAFYQTPARFWELAAGGMVAMAPVRALPRPTATIGLAIVLAACAWTPEHFPGFGALPAVAGAVLVVAAVHGGASHALLRWKPVVAVGLVSYSLYLWHWPMLALYRATSIGEGSLQMRLVLCALAFPIAAASYRYIEQPFRRMRFPARRVVLAGGALSAVLVLGACAHAWRLRVVDLGEYPLATQAERDMPPPACRYLTTDQAFPKCPAPDGARQAIWGDSMAYAWRPFAEARGPTIDYSRDACPPLLDWPGERPSERNCRTFNSRVAERMDGLDTVFLVARWRTDMPAMLPATLERLAPRVRRVVVFGPSPQMREQVPRCIRKQALSQCAISRAEFDAVSGPILAGLRRAAAPYANVEVVDLTPHFCTDSRCPAIRDGVPLYWDTHHVTTTAALRFALPAP